MSNAGILAFAALLGFATAGIVTDVRMRRLPNVLCLAVWVAGLVWTFADGGFSNMGLALVHSCLAFMACAGLFYVGWIGGGDAKFYAAFAAWFPLQEGLIFLLLVALAGGLLALFWLAKSARLRKNSSARGARPGGTPRNMPYGVAISAGAVATFLVG